MFDLAGRVVVVTGGLGRLGRRFSADLIAQGARVAIIDAGRMQGSDARRLVSRIGQRRLHDFGCGRDVSAPRWKLRWRRSRTAWERALRPRQQCRARCSARCSGERERSVRGLIPKSSFDRVMDVNVKGVLLCCQVFGGAMARAGRGSIVNIGLDLRRAVARTRRSTSIGATTARRSSSRWPIRSRNRRL